MNELIYRYAQNKEENRRYNDVFKTIIATDGMGHKVDSFYDVFLLKDADEHFFTDPRHPMHRHDFYSVWWNLNGKGTYILEDKEYPIESGMLGFVAPEQLHAFKMSILQSAVVLCFTEENVLAIDSEIVYRVKYGLFRGTPFLKLDSSESFERLRKIFGLLVETNQRMDGGPAHKYSMLTLISNLLCEILQTQEFKELVNNRQHTYSMNYKRYMDFIELVEKHYKQKRQVNDYLQLMNISFKTLTRTLLDCGIGKKPLEIINDRILLEAKRLLLHTSLSVHDIALALGFQQDSSFVKFFQSIVGLSPNNYRKFHQ